MFLSSIANWSYKLCTPALRVLQGEPGVLMVGKINGASPDAEVDIIFGKVTFKCLNVGDANITIQPTPSEDTIIGLSLTKYDSFIIGFCKGDFDSDGDMDGSDTALFKRGFGRSGYNKVDHHLQ